MNYMSYEPSKELKAVHEIVKQITYKDGWFIDAYQTVVHRSGEFEPYEGEIFLQVYFEAKDAETGKISEQRGRKWLVSRHMTKSEIVLTALKAILTAEEHEARELFRYKDVAIFHPHLDVDVMVENAKHGQAYDYRLPQSGSIL